jgi:N-acetyl-beta-hexosaminidase
MKRLLFSLFIAVCCAAPLSAAVDSGNFGNQFKLLPKPQKIEFLSGSFNIKDLRSVYLREIDKRPVLESSLSRLPLAVSSGKGVLTLSLSQNKDLPLSEEGYILEIKNGEIMVSSRGEAGLFYGCQTLAQLMEDAKDQQIEIPSLKITDFPDVPYRAVH